MRNVAVATALLVAACGGSSQLEDGFESELVDAGSCAGFLFASDLAGSLLLVVRPSTSIPDLAAGTTTETRDLAQADTGVVYVETGENLAEGFCRDAAISNTERRYHAIEGSVTVTAMERTDGDYDVTVALRDVLFGEELGDHRVAMAALDLSLIVPR
jgi:hypothetical protein